MDEQAAFEKIVEIARYHAWANARCDRSRLPDTDWSMLGNDSRDFEQCAKALGKSTCVDIFNNTYMSAP